MMLCSFGGHLMSYAGSLCKEVKRPREIDKGDVQGYVLFPAFFSCRWQRENIMSIVDLLAGKPHCDSR